MNDIALDKMYRHKRKLDEGESVRNSRQNMLWIKKK